MFNFLKLLKLLTLLKNTSNEDSAGKCLIESDSTLSIAESCTGGLVSSLMTDVSGSSSYTKANFVTYANEAKNKYLGVKEETLKEYGAVSRQTAHEMVEGLFEKTGSDYALATTGIAGPTGGTKEKPVGLVYIGVGQKENGKIKVYKYNVNPKFPRILIKYMFAKHAVKILADFLGGKKEYD